MSRWTCTTPWPREHSSKKSKRLRLPAGAVFHRAVSHRAGILVLTGALAEFGVSCVAGLGARRVAPPGAATARAAGLHRHPPADKEARLMARSLSRTNAVAAAAMSAAMA